MLSVISDNQISVIVQGPIMGKSNDPYATRLTYRCLESLRQYLPNAEIILSTWKGSNLENLSYDIVIENEDPGAFKLDLENKFFNNVNRQIVTTRSGLLKATREYALKFRSDMLLYGNKFLEYFGKYQIRCEKWKIVDERVLTCTVYSRNPRLDYPCPFHPSDWFFFGKTHDLLKIWDIPLASEPETSRWFETRPKPNFHFQPTFLNRYTPEQYIWTTFLKKYGEVKFDHLSDLSNNSIEESEISIVNNLVLLEPEQLQIKFIKYNTLPLDILTLYVHLEWLQLYQKYCCQDFKLNQKVNYIDQIRSITALKALMLNPKKLFMPTFLVIWNRLFPKSYIFFRAIFRNLTKHQEGDFFKY